jgi:hypothetical protein
MLCQNSAQGASPTTSEGGGPATEVGIGQSATPPQAALGRNQGATNGVTGGCGEGEDEPMEESFWQKRAEQTRVIAETLRSDTPFTKCEMLIIAATYRRLAKRARERSKRQRSATPEFSSCPKKNS